MAINDKATIGESLLATLFREHVKKQIVQALQRDMEPLLVKAAEDALKDVDVRAQISDNFALQAKEFTFAFVDARKGRG